MARSRGSSPVSAIAVLRQPPAADAEDAGEIARREYFAITRLLQQGSACGMLVVAMFEQQPAPGCEMRRCGSDNAADILEPVIARDQRRARLEAQVALREMAVARSNVRRIRHDHR